MRRLLWLSMGWIYVMMCPFILGGFISLVLTGPWGFGVEAIVWLILFDWFDGSQLQHDLT